jgi:hypothetical protein
MAVHIDIPVDAEVAALINKYSGDKRLMECATGALGNVLATHDRAMMQPSDQFDILAEVRRQAAVTVDTLVAFVADTANKSVERTDDSIGAVVARIEGLRGDATVAGDRVVRTVTESAPALVRDVGAVVRACVEDVVPSAVTDGMREHEQTDSARLDTQFDSVHTSIHTAGASVRATITARVDALQSTVGSVLSNVDATHTDTQLLRRHAEGDAARDASSSFKGQDGESRLIALLRSRLLRCDGWLLEDVHSQPHSCDLLVKRDGHASVRIECKRKKQITKGDIDKFHKDLAITEDHGLLISLEGAVAPGHTQGFSFERVHTGAGMRWAGMVVTGLCVRNATVADPDMMDLHHIVSALNVVQAFARLTETREPGDGDDDGDTDVCEVVCVSGDDLEIVKDEIKHAVESVQSARNRLKSAMADTKAAMACLDKISMKQIAVALAGDSESKRTESASGPSHAGACRYCDKPFVFANKLARHEKDVCRKRPK